MTTFRDIKELPENVKSILRTGVAISSVTHAIEELVLNAIDTRATCIAIRIDLEIFWIQVVDNGKGINKMDLNNIGKRYYTSKCSTLADLETNLPYYGYRGEALASLIEVSGSVEISSRASDAIQTYTKAFKKGKTKSFEQCDNIRPSHGTTVTLSNFYYNMPVRQNGIKPVIDTEKIQTKLECIALMHPHIAFRLVNYQNNATLLQTKKVQTSLDTFVNLFGNSHRKLMKHIDHEVGSITVTGYIGVHTHHNKTLQFLYINKRHLINTKLHSFINNLLQNSSIIRSRPAEEGKSTLSPPKYGAQRYGIFFLNISCLYTDYDISMEPQKSLVEFKDWDKILLCLEELLVKFTAAHNFSLSLDERFTRIPKQSPELESESPLKLSNVSILKKYSNFNDYNKGKPLFVGGKNKFSSINLKSTVNSLPVKRMKTATEINEPRVQESQLPKSLLVNTGTVSSIESFLIDYNKTVNESSQIPKSFEPKPVLPRTSSLCLLKASKSKFKRSLASTLKYKTDQSKLTSSLSYFKPGYSLSNESQRNSCNKFSSNSIVHLETKCIEVNGKKCSNNILDEDITWTSPEMTRTDLQKVTVQCHESPIVDEENISSSDDFTSSSSPLEPVYSRQRTSGFVRESLRNYELKPYSSEVMEFKSKAMELDENILELSAVPSSSVVPNSSLVPKSSVVPSSSASKPTIIEKFSPSKAKFNDKIETIASPFNERINSILKDQNNEVIATEISPNLQQSKSFHHDRTSPTGRSTRNRASTLESTGNTSISILESSGDIVAPCSLEPTLDTVASSSLEPTLDTVASSSLELTLDTVASSSLGPTAGNCCPSLEPTGGNTCTTLELPNIAMDASILKLNQGPCKDTLVDSYSVAHSYKFKREMLHDCQVIGQVDKKFIAVGLDVGNGNRSRLIAVIDQHAADERIQLEQILSTIFEDEAKRTLKRALLNPPITMTLRPNEVRIITANRTTFNDMGLKFEKISEEVVNLHSMPQFLSPDKNVPRGQDIKEILSMALQEMCSEISTLNRLLFCHSLPKPFLYIINSDACKAAVKFGHVFNLVECQSIIRSLSKCQLPFQCAHGRPSIVPVVDLSKIKMRRKLQKTDLSQLTNQRR